MTERLYLQDSHLFTNEGTVVRCDKKEDGNYAVWFDRSVFFPNKGGQPCDIGTAGSVSVISCDEKDGDLVHTCTAPLAVGEKVTLAIDKARRMDIMRQHTGEHILSWAASVLYGAVNVGFHEALDYSTLDTDLPLTKEQILKMEQLSNEVVLDNRAITTKIYETEEELKDVPLRKHTEGLEAPIRVVTIENSDSCTCCAPHVKYTGEIGLIKITAFMAYKRGMRITFLCGERAMKHTEAEHELVGALARKFSTNADKIYEAVEKESEALSEARKKEKELSARLETYLTAELRAKAEKAGSAMLLVEAVECDPKRIRPLCESTLSDKSVSLLFTKNGESVSYVIMSRGLKENMGEWLPVVNAALNGKGGGRGDMAQGSAPAALFSADTLAQIRTCLKGRLRG